MLTQHCDTGVDVVQCFLGQINVANGVNRERELIRIRPVIIL